MHIKKLICGGSITALLFSTASVVNASIVDINVNGSYINTNASAYIKNNHTMVPVRVMSRALGCDDISWSDREKIITLKNDNTTVNIIVGSTTAYVNSSPVKMPNAAEIINDRAYVGIRFLSEALNADIEWNGTTHTVHLNKSGIVTDSSLIDTTYTSDELDWLAKIVHAEAQGECVEGKIAVANVVLNRTESEYFPDNIYDVVFDTKYGIQFTPVANGTIHNTPSNESYIAAKKALFGENPVGESLYFCNPKISTNFWILKNRTFHSSIGNHDFYL